MAASLAALALVAAVASTTGAAARPSHAARGRGAPAHAAFSLNPGPAIYIMVVGAGNVVLEPPSGTSVPETAIVTSRGPCGIALGTPLGALVARRRTGGLPFAVRDYGHCTRSPANSGQLFVYSYDGETNHGQNGWEYKVNNRSGTAGAADPAGPFGNGHVLAPGSQLLWFWCQSFAGGCQRTLGVVGPKTVSRGSSFTVTIEGYDNDGRGIPMSGARVSFAGASAVTRAGGRVTFRAPSRAGIVSVRATRSGSVPAFPKPIVVR
ncbi:MAG TPA: hypothetical protein VN618_00450 [Solirubrobacteraceae bacterium]|nr:hypothetical protein [Solirubrobacteraceae bacterium]